MGTLTWILLSTFLMSLFAWVGLLTLALREEVLKKLLLPLVAFAAGSLIGGAFLHLIPESLSSASSPLSVFLWVLIGFSVFLLMEQFLEWHHHHVIPSEHRKEPFTYLILLADGLHNFIGGLAIGGSFLVSVEVGTLTWVAAVSHEIPQELGDFGILLRGGWKKRQALLLNFVSALTIVPGGVIAYLASSTTDTTFLLPFAAGNFLYIASSDLIPEIKSSTSAAASLLHFFSFIAGILLILGTRLLLHQPA